MNLRKLFISLIIGIGLPLVASENLIKNGSFEDFTIKKDRGKWKIVSLVDWQGGDAEIWNNQMGRTATDGEYKIELDVGKDVDRFSQDINLEVGKKYQISIDAYARKIGTSKFYIELDGNKILTVEPTTNWKNYSVEFNATKDIYKISIVEDSAQNNGRGAILDNIVLKEVLDITSTSTNSSYIPKDIDRYTAIRFLNKATFGATKQNIKDLQNLGIKAWLDKQLAIPATENIYLKNMIELSQLKGYNTEHTIDEYLEDNEIIYQRGSQRDRISSWFQSVLDGKDELRHKLTYALSQIIVESDFEPLFKTRAEALARYFDILYKNAFSTYKDVLQDITFSAGMGVYLTYRGNRAEYNNSVGVPVYPDENYAREIMQLFSIGLNELNIDGTIQRNSKGEAIPTYTQEDVNNLARVFTGWDVQRNNWLNQNTFGKKLNLSGDLTHPMIFFSEYHDFGAKKVLGVNIPAGLDGRDEILYVLDILMSNKNTAPFISKNLIIRLVKSNPSPEYVARVATVFKDSGGDLKRVVKAIFLDPEFWDDMKNKNSIKFKEPFIGYLNFLRAFNVKPLPYWYTSAPDEDDNVYVVHNRYFFDGDILRDNITQVAGLAPSVFNFYDNSYIPNDENFRAQNLVAPELQIQSDTHFINYSNYLIYLLKSWDKNYITSNRWSDNGEAVYFDTVEEYLEAAKRNHNYLYSKLWYVRRAKLLLDTTEELAVMEMVIDGDTNGDFINITENNQTAPDAVKALIEHLDIKLTGGRMSSKAFDAIYNNLKDTKIYYIDEAHTKRYRILVDIIYPAIRAIVTSNLYMTE